MALRPAERKQIVTALLHDSPMNSLDPAAGHIDLTTAVPGQRSPVLFDFTLKFQTPALRNMHEVWERKRGDRTMPRRSDFSMQDLAQVLPQTGIIDLMPGRDGPRLFVRLNGSALDHFFAPLTGRYIDEAVSPYFAERWKQNFMVCIEANRTLRSVSRIGFKHQLYLIGESVLLPLSEDGETPSGVLYAIFHYGSNETLESRQRTYDNLSEEHDAYCRGAVTSQA